MKRSGLRKTRNLLSRRRPARSGAGETTDSAERPTRRELLGTLGTLPLASALSYPASGAESQKKEDDVDAVTQPTFVTRSDKLEYARLKDLDLDDPKVVAKQRKMPVGKIGKLSVGRLVSGSNLISMNMHARDLAYVRDLAAQYNTEERIFMTLKRCEEYGINTIVLKNHNFKHFRLARYWDEWGGKMQWLADVITTDINRYEELLVEHLELGAASAYLWGGATDQWFYQKRRRNIIKAFEIMKKYDIPVGIGAHRLEPIIFCQREGLKPDYYIKTLHHDRYWSAHPQQNREFMEMYSPWSQDHAKFHDNLWCDRHQQTVAFMQEVKVPWIAFKVLAAGAIPPKDGLEYAFDNGADFVCLGMFDFQVKQDVELTRQAVAGAKQRNRPWIA